MESKKSLAVATIFPSLSPFNFFLYFHLPAVEMLLLALACVFGTPTFRHIGARSLPPHVLGLNLRFSSARNLLAPN